MTIAHRIWPVLAAFAGYWALGACSGFFAIPPGYASPIWPAAGLALLLIIEFGPRVLPGITLASFLLNLGFSNASLLEPSPAWIGAGFIALGSTLQTWVGYLLVRRFTSFPNLLARTHDSVRLALLGGPVACTVSCSVGVTTLFASGILSRDALAGNWLNWWIGDSIGVMALAPVILVISSKKQWSSGTTAFSFVAFYFVLVLLASTAFIQARASNESSFHELFREHVDGVNNAIHKQTDNISHASYTFAALFSTFSDLGFDQFNQYSDVVYEHVPGIKALSWVPIVRREERRKYEEWMELHYQRPYVFKQLDADKNLVPAAERDVYFPVYYIAPLESNERAVGFDLGSQPDRMAAIDQALNLHASVATAPIVLVQETGNEIGFLLLTPVVVAESVTGFVSSVFRTGDLIDAAITEEDLHNISIVITDVTSPDDPALVYSNAVEARGRKIEVDMFFAQRTWRLSFSPGLSFMQKNQSMATWVVLVSGFLVISVMGLFVLLVMSQKSAVENEVLIKTSQLQDALARAESASRVKGNFLASMSHELRTPLNSIIGFSVRSLKKLEGSDQHRVMESLSLIEKNGRYLLSLINDILDLSKIEEGKMGIVKSDIDIADACEEVMTSLAPMAEAKKLRLIIEHGDVVTLRADGKRFRQILVNLLSNAIKFTQAGSITLHWRKEQHGADSGVSVVVRDTGAGISTDDMKRLFTRFEQLGADFKTQDMGSGLGLSLVLELVSIHGGTVSVDSDVGTGSVFKVWFPDA